MARKTKAQIENEKYIKEVNDMIEEACTKESLNRRFLKIESLPENKNFEGDTEDKTP